VSEQNLIIVGRGEVTCLNCGETFPATWMCCPRCEDGSQPGLRRQDNTAVRTPTVPTVRYLRPGEYVER